MRYLTESLSNAQLGLASLLSAGGLSRVGIAARFLAGVYAIAGGAGDLCAQSDYSVPYSFTFFAGGTAGSNPDGTVVSPPLFADGLALANTGDIFVAERDNDLVRKVSSSGVVSTVAHIPFLAGSDAFSWPSGLALDNQGNLYVACYGNHQIAKVTLDGRITVLAGNSTPNPSLPSIPGLLGGRMPDPSNRGYTDGPASTARFDSPSDIVLDGAGNLYVCDNRNRAIRKITPAGLVSTVAGGTNILGPDPDGVGKNAFLGQVSSIAIATDGTLYAADSELHTIRKITPDGVVTTIAGRTNIPGSADGPAASARFNQPQGIAIDAAGNIYVGEYQNRTIRRISAGGVVTTLGGSAGVMGTADGTGALARFTALTHLAVSGSGVLYIVDAGKIRQGVLATDLPVVTSQPNPAVPVVGNSARFTVTVTDSSALTYQWQFQATAGGAWINETDGSGVLGSMTNTLQLTGNTALAGGHFRCVVTNAAKAMVISQPGGFDLSAGTTGDTGSHMINISTRSLVGVGENIQIAGFVIGGTQPKAVLIRASGPALAQFNIGGLLADPVLTVLSGQTQIGQNDDWESNANKAAIDTDTAQMHLFPFAAGSKDAALRLILSPGAYTAQVSGKNAGTGVALIEVYEVDPSPVDSRMVNISTRSLVGTGANVQIAGFVITGSAFKTVLIRANGRSLAQFGVTGTLDAPVLTLFSGQTQLAQNDYWDQDPTARSAIDALSNQMHIFSQGAGGDAAMIVTLPPGAYTAQVNGNNNTTGVALVEVYEVP